MCAVSGDSAGQAHGSTRLVSGYKFQHLVHMGFLKPTGISFQLEVSATYQMSLKRRMKLIQIWKIKVDVLAIRSGQIPPYTGDFPIEIIQLQSRRAGQPPQCVSDSGVVSHR
jgi:hypothetical protein